MPDRRAPWEDSKRFIYNILNIYCRLRKKRIPLWTLLSSNLILDNCKIYIGIYDVTDP